MDQDNVDLSQTVTVMEGHGRSYPNTRYTFQAKIFAVGSSSDGLGGL